MQHKGEGENNEINKYLKRNGEKMQLIEDGQGMFYVEANFIPQGNKQKKCKYSIQEHIL